MTRRLFTAVPLVVSLVLVMGAPANAVVVEPAGRVSWQAFDDASACFDVPGLTVQAVATAVGLIRVTVSDPTAPPPLFMISGRKVFLAPPTTAITGVESGTGLVVGTSLCVGGTHGLLALGGSAVFTFEGQSPYASYDVVVTCSYSSAGPNCVT